MNLGEVRELIIIDFNWSLAFKEGHIHPESKNIAIRLRSLILRDDEFVELLFKIREKWREILKPQTLNLIELYLQEYNRLQQTLIQMAVEHDTQSVMSDLGECSLQGTSVDSLVKCLANTGLSSTGIRKKPSKRLSKRPSKR